MDIVKINPESYKAALPTIFRDGGNHQVTDLAVITNISNTLTATNERQYKVVEFQYVRDLSSQAGNVKKGFVKSVFGPLLDAEGKVKQPADILWDRNFPLNIYDATGKAIAHPKAGKPMLAIGELVPISQVTFDTTEYEITSEGFDGVSRTNKVKKLTVICFDSENPLAIANSRMNGRVLGADGKPDGDKRLGGYVTGITTSEGEFIAIEPPTRVKNLDITAPVVNEVVTKASFVAAGEGEKVGA